MTVVSAERAKDGYLLGKDEGEAYWLLGMLQTIKIGRDDTAGQYGLLEIVVPAGVGSPWHVHPEEDEWFYVLEGELTFWVADTSLSLTAGSFAFGPKGVPHTFYAEAGGARARQPSGCCRRRSRATRTWSGCSRSQSATGWSSSALPGHLPATDQSAIQCARSHTPSGRAPQTGGTVNDVTITPTDNGPYLIQGNVTLLDAEGNRFEAGDTIALCRCGQSNTKPFCDGTHERVDFAAASRAQQLLAR